MGYQVLKVKYYRDKDKDKTFTCACLEDISKYANDELLHVKFDSDNVLFQVLEIQPQIYDKVPENELGLVSAIIPFAKERPYRIYQGISNGDPTVMVFHHCLYRVDGEGHALLLQIKEPVFEIYNHFYAYGIRYSIMGFHQKFRQEGLANIEEIRYIEPNPNIVFEDGMLMNQNRTILFRSISKKESLDLNQLPSPMSGSFSASPFLKEVILPPMKELGKDTFSYCPELEIVHFQKGIDSIKDAFRYCKKLKFLDTDFANFQNALPDFEGVNGISENGYRYLPTRNGPHAIVLGRDFSFEGEPLIATDSLYLCPRVFKECDHMIKAKDRTYLFSNEMNDEYWNRLDYYEENVDKALDDFSALLLEKDTSVATYNEYFTLTRNFFFDFPLSWYKESQRVAYKYMKSCCELLKKSLSMRGNNPAISFLPHYLRLHPYEVEEIDDYLKEASQNKVSSLLLSSVLEERWFLNQKKDCFKGKSFSFLLFDQKYPMHNCAVLKTILTNFGAKIVELPFSVQEMFYKVLKSHENLNPDNPSSIGDAYLIVPIECRNLKKNRLSIFDLLLTLEGIS